MSCKFCNSYGQIEIESYWKATTAWNVCDGVELTKRLRVDCPKCNGSGNEIEQGD